MHTAALRIKHGLALAAAALLAVLAVAASPAQATLAGTSCVDASSQPFLPWADVAFYGLAPGGSFESTPAWKLAGGAKVVSGNEPFYVNARTDKRSLSLPAGASATSPAFCVGLGDPTLRLFAVSGGSSGSLKVEVIGRTLLGTTTVLAAKPAVGRSWAPTLPVPLLANVTGLTSLDGLTSSIQVRLTAVGAGIKVDDVYVDPWKIH